MTQQDFLRAVVPGAQAGWQKYRVLPSPTIAQAIAESGWGSHAPGNNLFGIKANGWAGPTQTLYTAEETASGARYYIYALFRVYSTLAASVTDHGAFLAANSRYRNLLGVTDAPTVCRLLQADGYATETDYAAQLISIIQQYNLTQYDRFAYTHIDIPGEIVSGAFGVAGWALSPAGVYCVDIYADAGTKQQRKLGRVPLNINRPDVDRAYPGYNAQPRGWQLEGVKLARGLHTIDCAAIDNDKGVCWAHKSIQVA